MGVLDAENADRKSSSSSKSSTSTSSKSSSSGLNSAGNRASGAGPGASANRSTSSASSRSSSTPNGNDRPSNSRTDTAGADRREIDRSLNASSDRSLNASGNRATGAGPMSSANRNTTSTGLTVSGGTTHAAERGVDRSLGTRTTPATPTGGLFTSARAGELKSMADLDQYRATDLASKARAAENQSMADLAREKALSTLRTAEAGVKDPYNRLVSGGPRDYADLTSLSVREAIDMAGSLKAQGHLSNVLGGYQFKNTTLSRVATKLGVLDEKFTPEMQDRLAKELLQDRANRATVNGKVDVDTFASELAKEWASLATKTGSSYYDKNGVDKASVDYKTVRDMAQSLVDYGIVSAGKSQNNTNLPEVASQVPTSRPTTERFAGTYLDGKTNGGLSPKQIGDYKDYGLNRSYAPVDPVTRVATAEAQTSKPQVPSRQAPATKPEVATPSKPKELTTGQQVLAGGIDILGGLIPGVGTGLTVANAGLKLTGNRTVGEMIVNDMVNGSGRNGSTITANAGSDRSVTRKKPEPAKVSAQPAESFIDKYVAFVDPVKRPTPAQKWGPGSQYGQA